MDISKKRSLGQIGDKKSLKCIKIQVKIEQIAAKSSKIFACGATNTENRYNFLKFWYKNRGRRPRNFLG